VNAAGKGEWHVLLHIGSGVGIFRQGGHWNHEPPTAKCTYSDDWGGTEPFDDHELSFRQGSLVSHSASPVAVLVESGRAWFFRDKLRRAMRRDAPISIFAKETVSAHQAWPLCTSTI
jgi:hypothetical protein